MEQDGLPAGTGAGPAAGRRGYRSPLRDERSADTRQRIITAAMDLFAARGFAKATVTDIARQAGVAPQTIYASFGSKGGILRSMLTQLEEDADAAGWRAKIAATADPAQKLTAFAQWSGAFFSLSRSVLMVAQGAFGDEAIADLRAEGDRHRRDALCSLVAELARLGALKSGLTRQLALDRFWILTGAEIYLATTAGCGWTSKDYADWLSALLQHELLADEKPLPPASRPSGRTTEADRPPAPPGSVPLRNGN